MENIEYLLNQQQFAEVSIINILINLIMCMALITLVAWYYKKYSLSLGGKTHVGSVLPLVGLTVFLVITVVKSSLALSLGLVGALSIVRFRTPIKEPEELGFLFLSIAIGLGFGAGFQLVTLIVTLIILAYLMISRGQLKSSGQRGEYSLIVKVSIEKYQDAINALSAQVQSFKIMRLETVGEYFEVHVSASIPNNFDASKLIAKIQSIDLEAEVQMIESGVNW